MSFLNPAFVWMGLFATILIVLALSRHTSRRRQLARFLGGREAVQRVTRANLYRLRLERIGLLVFAALALACAAAGPQWQAEPVVQPPERSVVLTIDVSASMQASDVSPTRLARALEIAGDLVDTLDDTRVGLLLLAGKSYPLVPPTRDHEALRYFLAALTPNMASAHDPGSSLSTGIRDAVTLSDITVQELALERSVILIGDGEVTEEEEAVLLTAVREAVDEGVAIHAIGVGTSEGADMVMPQAQYQFGGPVVDAGGTPIVSRMNESLLERVAGVGGGRYAHADDGSALRALSGSLNPEQVASGWGSRELALLLSAAALAALLAESLLDVHIPRRRAREARRAA